MTIILTIIAAVIVIIGLVVFNVRSVSSGKEEPQKIGEERTAALDASPVEEDREQEMPPSTSEEDDRDVMNDQTYREILQKLQKPRAEQTRAPKNDMNDMDYRNALKSMQKRDQD
ncbi:MULTISPECIES: hypothetical protein [Bacillus]|uniref:hypothetical protein n=1 Tax=Bacillus TaxID=1386 RepID=UPI000404ADED|nr:MULTISPECIES: hypothetical protein [Bacillus]QHZ45990.1 hypothetical protein M654_006655 [Bacillus sp. NSP9.1]WFA06176.1 hypothetical protein P3X63_05125 [Bacillus sp. HSf4]